MNNRNQQNTSSLKMLVMPKLFYFITERELYDAETMELLSAAIGITTMQLLMKQFAKYRIAYIVHSSQLNGDRFNSGSRRNTSDEDQWYEVPKSKAKDYNAAKVVLIG